MVICSLDNLKKYLFEEERNGNRKGNKGGVTTS